MNREQNQKNNMYKKVLAFFGDFVTVFANFKRLTDEIKQFVGFDGLLDDHIQKQRLSSVGVTGKKGNIFTDMVVRTVRTSRKALVYAKDQDDEVLIALFDVRESDFYREEADEEMASVKNIFDALVPLANTLVTAYGADADDLTEIDEGIKGYAAIEGEPGKVIAAGKAATIGIKENMRVADESLVIIDDLLINTYDVSNCDMVEEYKGARLQDNIGIRHTGIYALLLNKATGKPVEGGLMKVTGYTGKEAVSDINGSARIEKMRQGTYHVEFSSEGFVSMVFTMTVIQGEHVQVMVEMEVG